MADQRSTVLIIDDDPETRTLLREQVFVSGSFQVFEAHDGMDGLAVLRQSQPDLIVLDLHMPGLSGHDMLVALKSQGYRGPLIVLADSGSEHNTIDAFRLGATDYITKPIREAEAASAVERGLTDVRLRRQRDSLVIQLQESNHQLEARINELTTLYDIGQSVTAMHELDALINRVLEGAISVTNADHAVLMLREDETGRLVLQAGRNMPLAMMDRRGEPIHDQLADLVMTSQEALTVAGEGLRKFSAAKDLYAVAYAPLVVQSMAVGVLAVGNQEKQAIFSEEHAHLLKALADYAAIGIVNARLFRMLEARAQAMETAYTQLRAEHNQQLRDVADWLREPLRVLESGLVAVVQRTQDEQVANLRQQARSLLAMLDQVENR
ncbi:MAG: response regulator [Anaerolineae bacterium]|nr:response regulator [Anaerolineae bacterium]